MILALVSGTVFRSPEQRTSKNGREFVTATLISKDGDASTFANVLAFNDRAKELLLALHPGDACCVQGKATIGVYEKNGEHRPSLSIVADQVMALRQPKDRKPAASAPADRTRPEPAPFKTRGRFEIGSEVKSRDARERLYRTAQG